jgi:hypothetical protein
MLGFTAGGSALLICFMVRCRMDEAIARERGGLAELGSALIVQRRRLESAISDARAEARRLAFDEFLNDFRVEQRQYVRKSRVFFMSKRMLIVRERILFRNLPLSNWVEHTVTLDENVGGAESGRAVTIDADFGLAANLSLAAKMEVA